MDSWTAQLLEQKVWLLPIAGFACFGAVAFFLDRFIWRRLEGFADATHSKWDDILLPRIHRPVQSLLATGVMAVTISLAPDQFRSGTFVLVGQRVVFIFCIIWFVDRFVQGMMDGLSSGSKANQSAQTLARFGLRLFLLIIGSLILLDNLGISITPLLASLGVSSLAVALALQDTLSNFFSGVYLLVERPIEPGQTIEVEGNAPAKVRRIGWRNTELLTAQNNILFIPNATVAKSRITNFDAYESRTGATLELTVAPGTDLKHAKAVLIAALKSISTDALHVDDSTEPQVRCTAFGERGVVIAAEISVRGYSDRGAVRDIMILVIDEALRNAGIAFAQPAIVQAAQRSTNQSAPGP